MWEGEAGAEREDLGKGRKARESLIGIKSQRGHTRVLLSPERRKHT